MAEALAEEIKRRAGEETIVADLTYDLRSGDPDFIDKLVALTFGNMAYDAILEGKTGLMSALVVRRPRRQLSCFCSSIWMLKAKNINRSLPGFPIGARGLRFID